MADACKDEGNALYKSKEWLKAAAAYTKGIKADPNHHVLYSNRSAAFLQLLKVQKALSDADMCIKLKPEWEKGYYRKGCALEALERFEEALDIFREAAKYNPENGEVTKKITNIARFINSQKRKGQAAGKENQVRTDDEYDLHKGDWKAGASIPYSAARVEAWAAEKLKEATTAWMAGDMAPHVAFLPGYKDQDGGDVEGQVAIEKAFVSPELLESCTEFLRKYAADSKSHAACAVVNKTAVAYPQVWKKGGWACGNNTGFFVQLDSPDVKRMWFVPCGKTDKHRAAPKAPVALDIDTFRLLPTLVKKQ